MNCTQAYQWDVDEKMTLWYESQNEENSTVWVNIEAVEENAITEDILQVGYSCHSLVPILSN